VRMAADLDSLITSEIPEGRQNLMDSYTNLERVAEYCENNYFQCDNKRAALEETKGYTTQSLASVAYQINTLAYNFLQMLDLQSSQIREMESQINHISQTVSIHKEKVARREIGVLTTNKCSNRQGVGEKQYKIIAPANPERPIKYVRKPIDYSCLDHIGHGVSGPGAVSGPRQVAMAKPQSQYGPGLGKSQYGSIGNVSQGSAGPAPTSKPPTPPQNRFQSGTLNRSKEYRTPPVVAPPQVPSNYAPNYPRGSRGQQYGTLPHHPQVGMVQPQPHDGGSTMPRLSSNSMRSTVSANSGASSTPPMSHDHYGTYGLSRKASTSSGDTVEHGQYGLVRQTSQASSMGGVYGTGRGATPPSGPGMSRPAQRPPSPPLPTPPPPQAAPGYQRQHSEGMSAVYGTRGQPDPGVYGTRGQPDPGVYGTRGQPDPGVYGTRGQPDPSVYGTRNQPDPNLYGSRGQPDMGGAVYGTRAQPDSASVYMTRGQVAAQGQEQTYSTRGQPPSQENLYSSRSKMAEQGYTRSVSTVSNPDNLYSSRSQMAADQNYKRSVSQSSAPGQAPPPAPEPQLSSGPGFSRQSSNSSNNPGAVPSWVPRNYLDKVLAIYDYNADKEDELTFQEGQTIYVLKKNDDGWWEGVMEGITGLFPGNYVESPTV